AVDDETVRRRVHRRTGGGDRVEGAVEILRIALGRTAAVPHDAFDIEIFVEIDAELRGAGEGAAAVAFGAEMRNVAVAAVTRRRDRAVDRADRVAQVEAAGVGAEHSAFDAGIELRALQALAGAGDDRDHAGV